MPHNKHRSNPLMRQTPASTQAVGIVWYTPEEWDKVKARAADAEVFEDTYEEWVTMAENAVKNFRIAGLNIEKVFVNADELTAWCIAHGRPNDGEARSRFVIE